jgi:hypothetical protein
MQSAASWVHHSELQGKKGRYGGGGSKEKREKQEKEKKKGNKKDRGILKCTILDYNILYSPLKGYRAIEE